MTIGIPLKSVSHPQHLNFGRPDGFIQPGTNSLHFLDIYTGVIGVGYKRDAIDHDIFRSFIPVDDYGQMQPYPTAGAYRLGIASASLASFAGDPGVVGVDFAEVHFLPGETKDYQLLAIDFQVGAQDAIVHGIAYNVYVQVFYYEGKESYLEPVVLDKDRAPDID
ncbi:hypothetical protein B2J88_46165 [Rhodococcus sp. SRB_17]|nr:hypothetical protein [Rhodococcus sp. SRB_17]